MRKLINLVLIISSMLLINVQMYAQNVGIGANTFTPDASAGLEIQFTNKGLLIPRMTTAQRDSISNPAQSLLIFNTTTKCYEGYLDGAWKQLACSFTCGNTLTVTHDDAGGVAPVDKTVTYGTVSTNLSGATKCWITQNLGATDQASSATDSDEPSAGWYWQFNRKQGYKHDGTTRTPNTTWISPIDESSDWLPANDPCTILLGTGWRIPTKTEWENADNTGGWDNYTETYNSVLKLHAAGYLYSSDGSLNNRGSVGDYWSSTQNSSTSGWFLYFISGYSNMYNDSKANGISLRCLRD